MLRLFIWSAIVGEQPPSLPHCIHANAVFKHNVAAVAHSMELYEFPGCTSIMDAREHYKSVLDKNRKLREINNFFFLKIPEADTNIHMVAIRTKIFPFLNACDLNIAVSGGEQRTYWYGVKAEAKRIYKIYDLIDDLHRDIPFHLKRNKLAHLYDLLGPEAYETGTIPPPLPLWLLQK